MQNQLAQRRTYKVIGDPKAPAKAHPTGKHDIAQVLQAAGNAPFHYACDKSHTAALPSPVPWRCHALDHCAVLALMHHLIASGDTTKVPNMLAAAQFLLQITWLPDQGTIIADGRGKEGAVFEGTLRNMEHIAAASAFIQSVLLAAEETGFKTYWSSGGPLRSAQTFEILAIPQTELLLGSIFLFPDKPQNAEIKPGAMAERRGNLTDWSRWCEVS